MNFVSNSDFHELEHQDWFRATKNSRTPVVTRDFLEKKRAIIEKALAHKFSKNEIAKMEQEKSKIEKMFFQCAMTKAGVSQKKKIAQKTEDTLSTDNPFTRKRNYTRVFGESKTKVDGTSSSTKLMDSGEHSYPEQKNLAGLKGLHDVDIDIDFGKLGNASSMSTGPSHSSSSKELSILDRNKNSI